MGIVNRGLDDRALTLISEIVGVGCGLVYATALLDAGPKSVSKVPVPPEKRKYMDFKIRGRQGAGEFDAEFEAKGTTSERSVPAKLQDIDQKKNGASASIKFGAITVARKSADVSPSHIVVTDDPPQQDRPGGARPRPVQLLRRIIAHYFGYLSFILDTSRYNQFIRQFLADENRAPHISTRGTPQVMERDGTMYLGEFFDRRLIDENVRSLYRPDGSLDELFRGLTKRFGRTKLFLGLDHRVIDLYNKRDAAGLLAYRHHHVQREEGRGFTFADGDGIIIVKSVQGHDEKVETQFTEEDVRRRLGYYWNYLIQTPQECGAPCRSRDREGKPCAIRTYRGHCHFHR